MSSVSEGAPRVDPNRTVRDVGVGVKEPPVPGVLLDGVGDDGGESGSFS